MIITKNVTIIRLLKHMPIFNEFKLHLLALDI
jgi:hypothetical protein